MMIRAQVLHSYIPFLDRSIFIRLRRRPRALFVDECVSLGWIIHAPQY
jgi:hypothetical protein